MTNTIFLAICLLINGVAFKLTQRYYQRRYNRRSQLLYMSLNEAGNLEKRLNQTKALLKGMN